MPFETTLDLLILRRDGVDESQWPQLSCSQAQQAALAVGDLRLDAGREVLFQDQGQIRSFDDAHKLVFNRAGNLLELHEQGDIRFLTGGPPPTERLRILATGQVGLGTATPTQALEVVGTVKAIAFQGDGAGLTGISATDATKVAKAGDTMTGPLTITAGGTGLRVTQNAAVGGTMTVTGNVGIGTTSPATKLEVVGNWTGEEGALRLTGDKPTVRFSGGALSGNQVWILHLGSNGPGNLEFFRRTGPASWSNVMALAPTGNIGIGTPAPTTKLHVRGARIRLEKAGTNQVLDLRADGGALDIESAGADLYLNNNNLPVRIRNLIQGSSREWKEDIADLPLEAAMQVLQHLNPISFAFKEDASHQHHLGFVAEEVPAIVATPDQKGFSPMAIIAVLTKVVKQQQEQISAFHKDVIWLKDGVK